jgi:hypothetical protein
VLEAKGTRRDVQAIHSAARVLTLNGFMDRVSPIEKGGANLAAEK